MSNWKEVLSFDKHSVADAGSLDELFGWYWTDSLEGDYYAFIEAVLVYANVHRISDGAILEELVQMEKAGTITSDTVSDFQELMNIK